MDFYSVEMKEDKERNADMQNKNVSAHPDGKETFAGARTGDLEWKEFFGQLDTFYSYIVVSG